MKASRHKLPGLCVAGLGIGLLAVISIGDTPEPVSHLRVIVRALQSWEHLSLLVKTFGIICLAIALSGAPERVSAWRGAGFLLILVSVNSLLFCIDRQLNPLSSMSSVLGDVFTDLPPSVMFIGLALCGAWAINQLTASKGSQSRSVQEEDHVSEP